MANANTYPVGILLVILYITMSAIREVFFALTLRQINIFVLIGLVFALATIIFTAFQARNLRGLLLRVRQNKLDIVYINITTALAWFSFIFSLQFIEPAVATSIVTALGPVSTLIVASKMLKDFKFKRVDIICAIGILFSIFFLGYLTITGRSGVTTNSAIWAAAGLLGATLSGFTSAANTVVTKRLVISGFKSSEIMVVRFYILVVASFCWIVLRDIPISMNANQFMTITAISFLGISIPLFALQAGIAKIDVNSVALIISVGPVITFVTQAIHGGFAVSLYSLVGIFLALFFVVFGIISKLRTAKSVA